MESWKICNFDLKANFNINFNISNVGYQGQVFKRLKGPLAKQLCPHFPPLLCHMGINLQFHTRTDSNERKIKDKAERFI